MPTIRVRDVTRDHVVAEGSVEDGIIEHESSYYFDPGQVDMTHLVISARTYTCPYKGVCHWIDLQTDSGVIESVGWVYTQPRPGYEHIRDKIAFAYGMRPGIMVQKI